MESFCPPSSKVKSHGLHFYFGINSYYCPVLSDLEGTAHLQENLHLKEGGGGVVISRIFNL